MLTMPNINIVNKSMILSIIIDTREFPIEDLDFFCKYLALYKSPILPGVIKPNDNPLHVNINELCTETFIPEEIAKYFHFSAWINMIRGIKNRTTISNQILAFNRVVSNNFKSVRISNIINIINPIKLRYFFFILFHTRSRCLVCHLSYFQFHKT